MIPILMSIVLIGMKRVIVARTRTPQKTIQKEQKTKSNLKKYLFLVKISFELGHCIPFHVKILRPKKLKKKNICEVIVIVMQRRYPHLVAIKPFLHLFYT